MRVRDWRDIVRDVIESDADPEEWRATTGPRDRGIGEDLYLAHPRTGVYLLKTYPKNPFERKGVGTKVARSIDDEIGSYLPSSSQNRFAIHPSPADPDKMKQRAQRVQETVRAHAAAPTSPDDLFEDMMEAIESPAFGPLSYDPGTRPEELDGLADTFEDAELELEDEIKELINRDDIGRGFD